MFYCSFVSIHYIICECGDTFPTEEALKVHLERDHHKKLVENEYKCETCEKVFSSARACLVHQRVHSGPQAPARRALSPGRVQRAREQQPDERRERPRALKRAHNAKNIVCEVCGKRYSSNAALGYHKRVHTGERPYQCTLCPKNFTMPLFLQIHTRTHTGERPYECPHCPKAFSNKAALLRHDRVHTGVKPYGCPKCGKHFTQSNSMKLHVKTVHLKMPAPYKSKSRRNRDALRRKQRAEKEMAMSLTGGKVDVAVEVSDAVFVPQVKAEVKAEPEPEPDADAEQETYNVYYDEDVYEDGEQMYQEVEIGGHPDIAMYEVKDRPADENVEVLYGNGTDLDGGEVLYELRAGGEADGEEVLYEDAAEAGDDGEVLEVLYEEAVEGEEMLHYEEVYEEEI